MTARGATRAAILAYIRVDSEPSHRSKIIAYMHDAFGTSAPATRMQLHRLIRDGDVEQTDRDWYKATKAKRDA